MNCIKTNNQVLFCLSKKTPNFKNEKGQTVYHVEKPADFKSPIEHCLFNIYTPLFHVEEISVIEHGKRHCETLSVFIAEYRPEIVEIQKDGKDYFEITLNPA